MTTTTLGWLVLTATMTALFWMPYGTKRVLALGLWRHLDNPRPEDEERRPAWARRALRAHANAVENLVVFAPLALAVEHLGRGADPIARGAAAAYFFGRLGHYIVYIAGVPVLRTVTFAIAWMAQLALAWVALDALR